MDKSALTNELISEVFSAIQTPLLICCIKDRKITFANPAFHELVGYENVLNTQLSQFFSGKCLIKVDAIFEIFRSGSNQLKENKINLKRKSGRTLIINLEAQTIQKLSDEHILFSLHDISEVENLHKQRENSIEQLSRLSKLADLGCISAGVAHEVNNPLATIMLCIETIQYLLHDKFDIPENIDDQFSIVKKSIDRISKLTHQMATLARNDKIDFRPTAPQELVKDIIALYKNRLILSDVQLETEFHFSESIPMDTSKTEQVIINIINNGIYAIEKKPSDRRLKISIKSNASSVFIEIWNNGRPIPNEIRDRIFTPFFTDKPIGQGTGLGLPISHRIMQSHGGDLRFKSSEKDGTCFILEFPKVLPISVTEAA